MFIPEKSFDRIAMDIVGPFPKNSMEYQFILVILDCVTRYPDAFLIKSISAAKVAEEFIKCIYRVGIPQESLTDQGTNFMSAVLKGVCATIKIWQLRILGYHPQTDCLVKSFKCTLKGVIWACIQGDTWKWELLCCLPFERFPKPPWAVHLLS